MTGPTLSIDVDEAVSEVVPSDDGRSDETRGAATIGVVAVLLGPSTDVDSGLAGVTLRLFVAVDVDGSSDGASEFGPPVRIADGPGEAVEGCEDQVFGEETCSFRSVDGWEGDEAWLASLDDGVSG